MPTQPFQKLRFGRDRDPQFLTSAADGGGQTIWLFADETEEGVGRRLFQGF